MDGFINLGEFQLDMERRIVIGPDGPIDSLTWSQVGVLNVLVSARLAGNDVWLPNETIAAEARIAPSSVANFITALKKALGNESIGGKTNYGYRLELPPVRGNTSEFKAPSSLEATRAKSPNILASDRGGLSEPTPGGYAELFRSLRPVLPGIEAFGKQNGVTPIDQYIGLTHSPAWLGWPAEKVPPFTVLGDYEPSPQLRHLMERFPASGAINQYYGLQSFACEPVLSDSIGENDEGLTNLRLSATCGNWRHISALQESWKRTAPGNPERPVDNECIAFHESCESQLSHFIQKHESRLYHQCNTEALLITSDNQIVVARRSGGVNFSHGLWSASFEEQVSRFNVAHRTSDQGDIFACAERGALEEFGVTTDRRRSRLLEVGVEWGNFTLAFIMLLRCNETFDEICNWSWEHVAGDPTEAAAIDCFDADDEEQIRRAFLAGQWTPSPRAKKSTRLSLEAPSPLTPAGWHPTARARLLAWLLHKNATVHPGTSD